MFVGVLVAVGGKDVLVGVLVDVLVAVGGKGVKVGVLVAVGVFVRVGVAVGVLVEPVGVGVFVTCTPEMSP